MELLDAERDDRGCSATPTCTRLPLLILHILESTIGLLTGT